MATADVEMPPTLRDPDAQNIGILDSTTQPDKETTGDLENGQLSGSFDRSTTGRDEDNGDGIGDEPKDTGVAQETRRMDQVQTETSHDRQTDTDSTSQKVDRIVKDGNKVENKNTADIPQSPAQPEYSETSAPAPVTTSPPNGRTLSLIDTSVSGQTFDAISSQDLASCAVSEADTDAPTSALESSTDILPLAAESSHDTPKKEPRKQSSAKKTRERSGTKSSEQSTASVRRLSATKIQELTASPESLPVASFREQPLSAGVAEAGSRAPMAAAQLAGPALPPYRGYAQIEDSRSDTFGDTPSSRPLHSVSERPTLSSRTISTPAHHRKSGSQPSGQGASSSSRRNSFQPSSRPIPLNLEGKSNFATPDPPPGDSSRDSRAAPSPLPPSFPIPPLSAPTFLQLELAAQRPSPLYVYQSYGSDIPYESSAVKFERLKNFLLLPPLLERTLVIGALACLDAWLWTLTILPMRFLLAAKVLIGWWGYVFAKEVRWLMGFVWEGLGRMWQRGRTGVDASRRPSMDSKANTNGGTTTDLSRRPDATRSKSSAGNGPSMPAMAKSRSRTGPFHHKRTKSLPSNLSSFHKADLLQFSVIIMSCMILTQLDASRMYHFIRAQSAVKLYVIYNLVEVADRLQCALGQDIFECLFSSETLSRNSLGRSKIMLPLGMFCLALVYNCVHVITLFYQVITLNVAVNSYSNALLTLLMSNQFVEIKGSVFKRIEKESLFQLSCADVVERFQLWLVLLIIGMRNVVEVGGLSVPGAGAELGDSGGGAKVPLHNPSILPDSFTILPSWLWSGEVLSPFVVVVASEMLVDWVKHAYINKFNNIKPNFYNRVLDILCKDYYTNAFVTPTLTRRIGLPLLPLSTLFIRASFQTYHMFLATHMPAPLPPSTQTSLSVESSTPTSPAVTAALERLDHIIRHALGRSVYGFEGDAGNATSTGKLSWFPWTSDDVIAVTTLVMVIFLVWLVLLIVKLFLGMLLLRYSRDRYARMKIKEHAVATGQAEKESFDAKGKQVGGFGAIEIGDERRRWIYSDDPEGLKRVRERERKMEEKRERGGDGDRDLSGVMRYEMVAKRIW